MIEKGKQLEKIKLDLKKQNRLKLRKQLSTSSKNIENNATLPIELKPSTNFDPMSREA
jgi:hypothetical protein